MVELPEFGVGDADIQQEARRLIPWLPDPHQCECGVYCHATTEYVAAQAMYTEIWKCPECGKRFYRGEE